MTRISDNELMSIIYSHLGGRATTIGHKYQIIPDNCPYCGADNSRDFHSSYGQIFPDAGYGYKCFANCETVGLYQLALHIGAVEAPGGRKPIKFSPKLPKVAPVMPQEKRHWQLHGAAYFEQYAGNLDKFRLWWEYKRIPRDIIEKHGLGVGVVPSSRCAHERLITPIIQNGELVMIRGRAIDCDCPKWLPAAGASPSEIDLILVDQVQEGDIVLVVENYVDALLVNETTDYKAVCTLSTSYWYPHWQQQLIERNPALVIPAFDGDVAGNGGTPSQVREAARKRVAKKLKCAIEDVTVTKLDMNARGWNVKWVNHVAKGTERIPMPAGVKLNNELTKDNVPSALLKWDEEGQDIGKVWMSDEGDRLREGSSG